jgi:hypothetical protein
MWFMHNRVAAGNPQPASEKSEKIEISVRGKWVEVPALRVNDQTIVVTGKRIRIATLHNEDWLEAELVDPIACVAKLKEHADAPWADIFCFSQKVPQAVPRYQYPMEMRSIAVAEVAHFKTWWEGLPQETRKNVRRSQKRGVVIEVRGFDADVIKGIADVQNETPLRQGKVYPHYGKSFEQVKRDHGEFIDRSDFICAYFENELIGFLKLVYRGNVASLLQLNSKAAHYDKRPSNALLAKAAELCEARGAAYLTYGKFNYGNKGQSPLRDFKIRHGFKDMLLPSYYVPLTPWGQLCVRARLYRGPLGLLPHGVITAALSVRSKWYNHRTQPKAGVA